MNRQESIERGHTAWGEKRGFIRVGHPDMLEACRINARIRGKRLKGGFRLWMDPSNGCYHVHGSYTCAFGYRRMHYLLYEVRTGVPLVRIQKYFEKKGDELPANIPFEHILDRDAYEFKDWYVTRQELDGGEAPELSVELTTDEGPTGLGVKVGPHPVTVTNNSSGYTCVLENRDGQLFLDGKKT